MARKSMIGQMSKQMDIPRKEAGGLMAKAKKMNDASGYKKGGHVIAISVYNITHGSEDVPVEWGRKKLDRGTEKLIQGTESQVRGRYFNDNDGKGTF
jgi:hypothetical protein